MKIPPKPGHFPGGGASGEVVARGRGTSKETSPRDRKKTELFGDLNVGNHGNMWNIISWKVMKLNLWNVDQAPKCCDISILYLHEGIEDACPYLQHPATMNPNWAWHVYLLVVPPPHRCAMLRCYALRPGVSSHSWSKGPKKPWRWRLWMARQFIALSHKWPSQDCFETKAWLVDM